MKKMFGILMLYLLPACMTLPKKNELPEHWNSSILLTMVNPERKPILRYECVKGKCEMTIEPWCGNFGPGVYPNTNIHWPDTLFFHGNISTFKASVFVHPRSITALPHWIDADTILLWDFDLKVGQKYWYSQGRSRLTDANDYVMLDTMFHVGQDSIFKFKSNNYFLRGCDYEYMYVSKTKGIVGLALADQFDSGIYYRSVVGEIPDSSLLVFESAHEECQPRNP